MRARSIGLLLLGQSLLMGGCDASPSASDDRHFEPITGSRDAAPTPVSDWLDDASQAVPERWLVNRLSGRAVPTDDPQVVAIGVRFDRLAPLFEESRRMLANRTLQIHRMLGEAGVREPVVDTLSVFEHASGRRRLGNFGQYGSYYVTLRRQGLNRQEAAQALWKQTPADSGSSGRSR
ncbi:hypothetical protein [Salinisphaera sp. T31B1]|uniref:hypothetical protein n=1 Tax=Salinisphaera sp. T31B1 TaxID=727963 RepID=UPI0033416AAF